MKRNLLIILTGIWSCVALIGAEIDRELIRQPGEYSLDASGSTLTISKEKRSEWPLRIDWRSKNDRGARITDSVGSDRALIAEGWFTFVEAPRRIWVFDGERSGMVFTSSGIEVAAAVWSGRVMVDCPEEVWAELPNSVRDYWKRVTRDWTAREERKQRANQAR